MLRVQSFVVVHGGSRGAVPTAPPAAGALCMSSMDIGPVEIGQDLKPSAMLHLAKVRPLLAPLGRLQPLLRHGAATAASAATTSAHRQLRGQCRLFSGTGRLRFSAGDEDEINESVGKVASQAGNDRRQNQAYQDELEGEDEIFASVGERLNLSYKNPLSQRKRQNSATVLFRCSLHIPYNPAADAGTFCPRSRISNKLCPCFQGKCSIRRSAWRT